VIQLYNQGAGGEAAPSGAAPAKAPAPKEK
jgi:hypothetical protein